jgi:hypothetical protein
VAPAGGHQGSNPNIRFILLYFHSRAPWMNGHLPAPFHFSLDSALEFAEDYLQLAHH